MEATIVPRVKPIERPMELSLIETAGENVLERFRQDLRDIGMDLELFGNRMGTLLRTSVPRTIPTLWKEEFTTPVDLEDKGTNYEVRMNLPGIPKELVSIRFLDQTLDVEGETKAVKETEKKNYVLHERSEASYHRRVNFPMLIAPEKTEAKLDHGVLVLNVPKLKPAKEHHVPVS